MSYDDWKSTDPRDMDPSLCDEEDTGEEEPSIGAQLRERIARMSDEDLIAFWQKLEEFEP